MDQILHNISHARSHAAYMISVNIIIPEGIVIQYCVDMYHNKITVKPQHAFHYNYAC